MEIQDRSAAHLAPDEGRTMRAPGGSVTYKVTAGQTSGAYSLFELTIRPGEGVPAHIQHREDECFYVVDGELEFLVDEEVMVVRAGSLIYVPRGTVHAFTNTGAATARVLDLITPGGSRERFFEEAVEGMAGGRTAPDAEKMRRISAGYGIEVLPAERTTKQRSS